jgi:hypothetical protein
VAPFGGEVAVICDLGLHIVNAKDGSVQALSAPGGDTTLQVRWSPDGSHLIAVVARATSPQSPLQVYEVEPTADRWSLLATSDAATDWVSCCPSPAISPDGRWVIGQDGGAADHPMYRIDVPSGMTLALSSLGGTVFFGDNIVWLPGGTQALIGDGTNLDLVDLARGTERVVGSMPTQDFAWRASAP